MRKGRTEILSHIFFFSSGIGGTIQKKLRLRPVVKCGSAAASSGANKSLIDPLDEVPFF